MTYRMLYLVRHGQMNPDPHYPAAQHNGWPLTSLGCKQARLTGQRLCALPIQRIYHSPYLRALQTAQLIGELCPSATLQPTSLLCECVPAIPDHFYTWYTTEYQPALAAAPVMSTIPAPMRPWLDVWTATTSRETIMRDAAQIADLIATHFRPSPNYVEHEVLVSHSNLLGAVICHVLGQPAEQWLAWADLCNCSISEIQVAPNGQMHLRSFNDVGHLPYTLRSDNDRPMYLL
jgi:probable phosphoglycerate mutase